MPESRVRKTAAYTPPASRSNERRPSPRWWAPVMLTLMVLGLAWIVIFYISQTSYPIPKIGNWNLAIGFGLLLAGFGMTTRWR